MTNEKLEQIKKEIKFPKELQPENINELIERMYDKDNKKVGRLAKKEEEKEEFKTGLITAAKKAIQIRNKADQTTTDTKAAREDRLLRVRDSNGKATAR